MSMEEKIKVLEAKLATLEAKIDHLITLANLLRQPIVLPPVITTPQYEPYEPYKITWTA